MIRLRKGAPTWGRFGLRHPVQIVPGDTYEGEHEKQLLADFPFDFEVVEPEPVATVTDTNTYETRVMLPKAATPKRQRGRPRGSKNRPKV